MGGDGGASWTDVGGFTATLLIGWPSDCATDCPKALPSPSGCALPTDAPAVGATTALTSADSAVVLDDCSVTLLSASCSPASATVDSALLTGGVGVAPPLAALTSNERVTTSCRGAVLPGGGGGPANDAVHVTPGVAEHLLAADAASAAGSLPGGTVTLSNADSDTVTVTSPLLPAACSLACVEASTALAAAAALGGDGPLTSKLTFVLCVVGAGGGGGGLGAVLVLDVRHIWIVG